MADTTTNTAGAWFDAHGWIVRELPAECISDCSAPGPADDAVAYWRRRLAFDVPRDRAIDYLRAFGAWDVAELDASTDHELADRVLWVACGDLRESGEWLGLIH